MTHNETVLLGRQPILDADRMTFGYELIDVDESTPPGAPDDGSGADGTHRGQIVMQRVLLDWGMERTVGHRFGLIRTSFDEVRSGIHRALPPEGVILEIDAADQADDADAVLGGARADGYHFALTGITSPDDVEGSPLLGVASLAKVDVEGSGDAALAEVVAALRARAPKVMLVAAGVDTLQVFARCTDIGFDLFQGYFFAQPEILRRESRPTGSAAAIKLLAEMQSDDLGVDRAEQLVAADPTLAFRLLSVVNSSAFGLDRRVESLRHAIVLLGMTQVRNLAMLLTVSTGSTANEELIALGATRARFASDLQGDRSRADSAFTVGLLSVADTIFRTPMDELVAQLPVSDEISEALVAGTGDLGEALALARACERSDPAAIAALGADVATVMGVHARAAGWADDIREELPADRRRTSPLATASWFDTPPSLADRVTDAGLIATS